METMNTLREAISSLLDGRGWVVGDVAVSIIALSAALTSMFSLTGWPSRLGTVSVYLISAGWLIMFARMFIGFSMTGDPLMPPLVIIGLSCVGAGQVFYTLALWKKKE